MLRPTTNERATRPIPIRLSRLRALMRACSSGVGCAGAGGGLPSAPIGSGDAGGRTAAAPAAGPGDSVAGSRLGRAAAGLGGPAGSFIDQGRLLLLRAEAERAR